MGKTQKRGRGNGLTVDLLLVAGFAYTTVTSIETKDNYLDAILEGVSKRACNKEIDESELGSLQSIFSKLLAHFNNLEDIFALNHFVEILDVMYGSSRNIINMQILNIATRNGYIHDPATIQLLLEISQSLHDGIDLFNMKDNDNQQPARLISRFVQMVDYGIEMEHHLTFLVECRGAFSNIEELKETLVHSCNCLAIKAMKEAKKHISFVKSCIAFSEVTIPSISACPKQLNLYLETAEVALVCGLVSHSDGLIDSALGCLQTLDLMDGFQILIDVDGILSLIRKLCSLLVMVPGNPEQGAAFIPKSILSLVSSQSWITPKMRARILCAIISLSATLSQNKLPYNVDNIEILGNDLLFFGDSTYLQDLVSLSEFVLEELCNVIQQEPSQAARGSMALEACNCIASSFKVSNISIFSLFCIGQVSPEISPICSKLMETAQLCLSSNNKYLQSTMKLLGERLPSFPAAPSIIIR
ncbi:UPF0505 protein C16orf62-like [Vitis vinifera]|uniref:UPF0505 protein C16orf62-like n=1 Tax=Vitis vinifera TaxID=29760 RepID=A0A438ISJ5_VITVI|nr:UPF0505 protein C16orf62-like [Vitis vinifera]